MAIDLSENLISLTEAAQLCPKRRGGKKVHLSCVYRWTVAGCKGVVLECIQVGGTRCTSVEALERFFHALTHGSQRPDFRTPTKRRLAAEQAMRELEREGV